MPDFKEIAKNRWEPVKNETSLRGQVGAALGRRSESRDVSNYTATPLDQLRDPSTFAPPPRRLNSGVLPPPRPSSSSSGARSQSQHGHTHQEQDLIEEAPRPPLPSRGDTTADLPPPLPGRRDATQGRSPIPTPPPPYSVAVGSGSGGRPAPPSLPPRLPPRTNSASSGASSSPVVSSPTPELTSRQGGYLNRGAMDRLGAAGVSVPGFGIGGGGSKAAPAQAQAPAPAPSQGTTWAQKQDSVRTMSNLKKDPHSVSFSDARSAASTANNFRQRHGEQVTSGMKKMHDMDQKYGVSNKVGGYMSKAGGYIGNRGGGGGGGTTNEAGRGGGESPAQSHLDTIGSAAGLSGKKKPPPPPPRKKPGLGGGGSGARDEDAPPVPTSTRPY